MKAEAHEDTVWEGRVTRVKGGVEPAVSVQRWQLGGVTVMVRKPGETGDAHAGMRLRVLVALEPVSRHWCIRCGFAYAAVQAGRLLSRGGQHQSADGAFMRDWRGGQAPCPDYDGQVG